MLVHSWDPIDDAELKVNLGYTSSQTDGEIELDRHGLGGGLVSQVLSEGMGSRHGTLWILHSVGLGRTASLKLAWVRLSDFV